MTSITTSEVKSGITIGQMRKLKSRKKINITEIPCFYVRIITTKTRPSFIDHLLDGRNDGKHFKYNISFDPNQNFARYVLLVPHEEY